MSQVFAKASRKRPNGERPGEPTVRGTASLVLLATVVALGVSGSGAVGAQPWPPELESSLGLERGRLGIHVQPMTEELREYFHAPRDRGVLVSEVTPGRPAAEGGVQVGDVILSAGGTPIQRPFDLIRAVARAPQGEDLLLIVVRDGEEHSVVVKPEGQAMPWIDPGYWQEWAQQGLRMGSEELRNQLQELDRRLRDLEKRLEDLQEKSEKKDGQRTSGPATIAPDPAFNDLPPSLRPYRGSRCGTPS